MLELIFKNTEINVLMSVSYKYYNNTTVKPGDDTMTTKSKIGAIIATPFIDHGASENKKVISESESAGKLLSETLNALGSKYVDITATYDLRPGVNGVVIDGGVTVKMVRPYITEGRVDFALSKALDSLNIAVKKINAEGEYGEIGIKHIDFIVGDKKSSVYALATVYPTGKDFIDIAKVAKRTFEILKGLGAKPDTGSVVKYYTFAGMRIGFEVNTMDVHLRNESNPVERPSLGSKLRVPGKNKVL